MSRILHLMLLALTLAGGLMATEKASPALQRGRQTSSAREISVKPLFIYSARGRRDPFVFDISLNNSVHAVSENFNISELRLVGLMGTEDSKTALFFNAFRAKTYRFRRGQLFSPEGTAIANVKGTFMPEKQVTLVQGESSVVYKLAQNSRLQSLEATIVKDRKEQQR